MAGFKKAVAEQAALKISGYGPPGSGKTLTALLIAEGLARISGKRIAYVDTEHGTDFYCKTVPERSVHPAAFDFDALYSKSLTTVLEEVRTLDPKTHGVIVIDQISHLWDAAKAAYTGKRTAIGSIPMPAWEGIKRPYHELMHVLINSPCHVVILGRQSNDFSEDEDGNMQANGVKMRAEKETQYEPHICLRFDPEKNERTNEQTIFAFAEKDRSGVLQGKRIQWPNFEKIAAPILPYLGHSQAKIESSDDAAARDIEARRQTLQRRKEKIVSLLSARKIAPKDALAHLQKKYGVDDYADLTDAQAAEVIAALEAPAPPKSNGAAGSTSNSVSTSTSSTATTGK